MLHIDKHKIDDMFCFLVWERFAAACAIIIETWNLVADMYNSMSTCRVPLSKNEYTTRK